MDLTLGLMNRPGMLYMSCIEVGTRLEIGLVTADFAVVVAVAEAVVVVELLLAEECCGSITVLLCLPLVSLTTTSPLGGWPFRHPRLRLSSSSSLVSR